MKHSLQISALIIAVIINYSASAQIPPPPSDSNRLDSDDTVYIKAEKMPVFPGECENLENVPEQAKCTESAIINHVVQNTIYPKKARKKGIEGRVFVEFIVGADGKVTDIKVLKGVHPTLDSAAVAAVKTLPYIIPAVQRGKNVKLKYTIPVNFILSNKN